MCRKLFISTEISTPESAGNGIYTWRFLDIQLFQIFSIKVVHEQSGKVEYERERLLGIANKLMNFQSDSQQPFALVFDFSALLVDNLN
jgi:hypothetical protein